MCYIEKTQLVSRGCIKKLRVETVAYVFNDIPFLDSHNAYILKNGLKLLKGKALIPNYGRSKATNLALMVEERIIFETHFN